MKMGWGLDRGKEDWWTIKEGGGMDMTRMCYIQVCYYQRVKLLNKSPSYSLPALVTSCPSHP